MVTFSELCQDVEKIGNTFGLEWSIDIPPKATGWYEYRIVFRNNLLQKPMSLAYEIVLHEWKRFQNDYKAYETFIQFLTAQVKENIINLKEKF